MAKKKNGNGAGTEKPARVTLKSEVIAVLKEHKNKAMKCKDLIEAVKARGRWNREGKTPHQTLAAQISSDRKKGEKSIFVPGDEKGTYKLRDPKTAGTPVKKAA